MTRHRFNGGCPDQLQPDARDPTCPACYPAATGVPCPTCDADVGVTCGLTRGPWAGRATASRPHDARRAALRALEHETADA